MEIRVIVKCILFTLIGFLSGSVMFSYFLPKRLKNIDVREASPDRNPGGINAMRSAGTGIGLLCIALDVLKGFAPVYAAVAFAGISGPLLIPVMAAPVFGHAFSPFLNFDGGKAVSVTFGALLGVWPVSRAVVFLIFFTLLFKFVAVIRPDSSCICTSMCISCLAVLFFEPYAYIKVAFLTACAVVVFRVARRPDEGVPSLSLGCYTLSSEKHRLKIRKP